MVAAGFYHTIVLTGGFEAEENPAASGQSEAKPLSPEFVLGLPSLHLPSTGFPNESSSARSTARPDPFLAAPTESLPTTSSVDDCGDISGAPALVPRALDFADGGDESSFPEDDDEQTFSTEQQPTTAASPPSFRLAATSSVTTTAIDPASRSATGLPSVSSPATPPLKPAFAPEGTPSQPSQGPRPGVAWEDSGHLVTGDGVVPERAALFIVAHMARLASDTVISHDS